MNLTGITPTTLQNWTNRGYLGRDKVGLGRGAIRLYSAREIEAVAVAMELVRSGVEANTACTFGTIIAVRTLEKLQEYWSGRLRPDWQDAPLQMASDLRDFIAIVRPVRDGEEEVVSIRRVQELDVREDFPNNHSVIVLPVGAIKTTLRIRLESIELSKPTARRSTATSKRRGSRK